ncbi:hypothetical protein [Verrucomicrobium spinosum]|uniref:hypothetical protein n=1 Tax=Verrucomicrobium spinosum TaxID=2736 RepID=UPI000174445C|nr:hypothetical protein [Verrucomicrobium spinosum]
MESLTERFNLVSPTQDWEYINAQETNEDIEVLVEALEGAELSEDEDYATMLIVVNSIDALIEPGEPLPKVWDRTVSLLRRNVKAYEPIIDQFISLESKPENRYYISKHLLAEFPEFDPDAKPAAEQG